MKNYSSISRQRLRLPALLGTLLSLGLPSAEPAAAAFVTPQELIDASRSFLELRLADYLQQQQIEARHEILVSRLDPRLRLAACPQPLSIRLESPSEPIGRVSLRVQCEVGKPWTIFVPGQVRLFRQIVVATRPLKRQTPLTAADLRLAERDIGSLHQGYLTEIAQALGNKTTRPLLAEQPLTPSSLELAETIRRGDQVLIRASGGALNVSMPGEALSDGALGQQIRVRNLSSQRVIKARVTAPGQVEVGF